MGRLVPKKPESVKLPEKSLIQKAVVFEESQAIDLPAVREFWQAFQLEKSGDKKFPKAPKADGCHIRIDMECEFGLNGTLMQFRPAGLQEPKTTRQSRISPV
jgi:hypothetical protein